MPHPESQACPPLARRGSAWSQAQLEAGVSQAQLQLDAAVSQVQLEAGVSQAQLQLDAAVSQEQLEAGVSQPSQSPSQSLSLKVAHKHQRS